MHVCGRGRDPVNTQPGGSKPSLGARRLVTDDALQDACGIRHASSGGKEKNRPMAATLQQIPLMPDTQPNMIVDCYALIEQEGRRWRRP